jgi:polyisoprenoid-binding protein YceI
VTAIRFTLLCAAWMLAQPVPAAEVDYAASEITFVSRQMNVPVEGRFRSFSAAVRFDPGNLDSSVARIEVDLGSVDTGSAEADTEVRRRNWFNVAAFPSAKFVSTGVRQLGPDRYEVRGNLTLKGVTREVVAPVTVTNRGDALVFEGGFTLMRLQFRIGEGAWSDTDTVANEVQVRFRIVQTGDAA